FPMPTAWEPCPGKANAAVINTPGCRRKIPQVGPKDTAGHGRVKRCGFRALGSESDRVAFPCHCPQNPYKPPHPWIPAVSLTDGLSNFTLSAMLMWQAQSVRRPVL